jgi:hypothetical protein
MVDEGLVFTRTPDSRCNDGICPDTNVEGDIQVAFLEFQRLGLRFANIADGDPVDLRRTSPVRRILPEHELLPGNVGLEYERAAARGLPVQVCLRAVHVLGVGARIAAVHSEKLAVEDSEFGTGKDGQKPGLRFLQHDHDPIGSGRIHRLDAVDQKVIGGIQVHDPLDRPFHVGGRQVVSACKLNARAQRKRVCLSIRRMRPRRRQGRLGDEPIALERDQGIV